MAVIADVVEINHPEANPDLSHQAAQLILEIGIYRHTRDVETVLGLMAGRTTVVALDGYEQVIGTAGLRRVDADVGMIQDVVADPRKRGLGIGRRVVEAVEDVAYKQGILELGLESSLTAVPFYQRLGYSQLDERMFRKFL